VNAGDVVLVWFPFSSKEPVPYKKRPVLVLGDHGQPPSQVVIVVMITGSGERLKRPRTGDVLISDWSAAGLWKESTVRTHRLWSAEGRDIEKRLGSVDQSVVDDVKTKIADLLGLPGPSEADPPAASSST